jgi:hypothetical protein
MVKCRAWRLDLSSPRMRDIEVIDSELRVLAAVRRAACELNGLAPSTAHMDDLLDERSACRVCSGKESTDLRRDRLYQLLRPLPAGRGARV